MTGRKYNKGSVRGNFNSGMQNPQSRNRFAGPFGNKPTHLMNPVNPWLPQNVSSNFGNMGRNIGSDPQAQLALASSLIKNLLGPESPLNKFSQPPSLLSLGTSPAPFRDPAFNRDRFGIPRSNVGKIQKRPDLRNFGQNKRFGNDRKNQGPKKDQNNKNVTAGVNVEKHDISKNVENKIENNDVNQAVSVKEDKNENNSSTANTNKENGKTIEDEVKVSYNEIPFALLFCHICRKHMWDDVSFEKHLEGKPHKLMVEELERSYDLKVALLRHEMRVMEQQRENDIQRAFRKGKSKVKMQQRDFCAMCNLNFLGLLPAHRKNERHQRLKKFLHPKCSACTKEFYTRLEWDEHKLSAAHLKKLADVRKETRPDLEDSEFDIIDFIEDVNEEFEAEIIDVKVSGKRETVDELIAVNSESTEDNTQNKESTTNENPEKMSTVEKDENEREEKTEDDEETRKLPKYVAGNPVGEYFLMEKKGYLCRACNRFMMNREDNKIHCQTITHYNNIIKILKAQNKIAFNKKRSSASKNGEEKMDDISDSPENDPKRQKLDESLIECESEDYSRSDEATEKCDPENSESEPEKDNEMEPDAASLEATPEEVKKDPVGDLPRTAVSPKQLVDEEKKPSRPLRPRRGRLN